MMHDIPILDRRGLREFGLVTGAILAGLFGLFLPWLFNIDYPKWPWIVGGALGLWGIVAPMTLDPVYRTWMKFGLLLSRITTPIVLGIVFFGVIFPIGFAMRMAGRDPMTRRLDNDVQSYRVLSVKAPKKNMNRPF